MMVPGAVLLMPRYIAYSSMGWLDTLLPLIIPHLFIHVGTMFFFIQYMKGIPSELFEAAKIDGCSTFRMFLQIMFPLLLPAVAAQDIFWFMGIWNDYFAPSIYLSGNIDSQWLTLQVALMNFNVGETSVGKRNLIFAASTISSIPMIVFFLCFRNMFVQSTALSGVKE